MVLKIKIERTTSKDINYIKLVAELDKELQKFGLSLEFDDNDHDGFDIVILSKIKIEDEDN